MIDNVNVGDVFFYVSPPVYDQLVCFYLVLSFNTQKCKFIAFEITRGNIKTTIREIESDRLYLYCSNTKKL